jgi:hypothetical protein
MTTRKKRQQIRSVCARNLPPVFRFRLAAFPLMVARDTNDTTGLQSTPWLQSPFPNWVNNDTTVDWTPISAEKEGCA